MFILKVALVQIIFSHTRVNVPYNPMHCDFFLSWNQIFILHFKQKWSLINTHMFYDRPGLKTIKWLHTLKLRKIVYLASLQRTNIPLNNIHVHVVLAINLQPDFHRIIGLKFRLKFILILWCYILMKECVCVKWIFFYEALLKEWISYGSDRFNKFMLTPD